MSSSAFHRLVGVVAGGAAAGMSCSETEPESQVAEVMGGILGGLVGSLLPDFLEPATWWGHRGPAHSVTTLALVGGSLAVATGTAEKLGVPGCGSAHEALEEQISNFCERYSLSPRSKVFARGIVKGLLAGYGTHLLMDSTTPMGLPG